MLDDSVLYSTSGIGVANLGHCHPAVTKAAQKQCGEIVSIAKGSMKDRLMSLAGACSSEYRILEAISSRFTLFSPKLDDI